MKLKKSKKGLAFEAINKGMIAFLGFVLITVLVILLVSQAKQTSIVCGSDTVPVRFSSGFCQACPSNDWQFHNTTVCCNSTTTPACDGANQTAIVEFTGAAYNATADLSEASLLPPQFAQIIVIVVIIVAIIGMLSYIGYGAYQRMRR